MKKGLFLLSFVLALVWAGTVRAALINEIESGSSGAVTFIELYGEPNESLDGLTLIHLGESYGGSAGVVKKVADLSGYSIPSDRYFVVGGPALPTMDFPYYDYTTIGGTFMLVRGYTGYDWQNLDYDDDGILEETPWTSVVASTAFVNGGDVPYSPEVVGYYDDFWYSHGYRSPDGSGTWTWESGSGVDPSHVTPGSRNYSDNAPPTDITLSASEVDERADPGMVIGTLSATDPNPDDTHTFTLVAPDDGGGRFKIVGNQLQVRDGSLLDYETSPILHLTVRATDSFYEGNYLDKTIAIQVHNVEPEPLEINLASDRLDENAPNETLVGILFSTNPALGDTQTYSFAEPNGDASGRFKLVGNELRVADWTLIDYELDPVPLVTIRITVGGSYSYTTYRTFAIHLNDLNEASTDIALSGASVRQNSDNGTVLGTLSTVDEDPADTHAYTFAAPNFDAGGCFEIVGDQVRLKNKSQLNAQAHPTLPITIQVIDSGPGHLSFVKSFLITVTPDNAAPVVDLNGAGNGTSFARTLITGLAGGSVQAADPTATITDSDNGFLVSMTVRLLNHPDGANESLAVSGVPAGLTMAPYNPASGVLQLTGLGTLADYQTVLRSLQYTNLSATPDMAARTIEVTVNDGAVNSPAARAAIGFSTPGATAYYVDASRTDDMGDGLSWGAALRSIQAALDAAMNDPVRREVWVAQGQYGEYLGLGSSLSLYGGFAGSETSIGQRDPATHVTTINGKVDLYFATSARLDGFTIQGTLGLEGCDRSNVISRCNFQGAGDGIDCWDSDIRFDACTMQGNSYRGILVYNCSPAFTNCNFLNNGESGAYCHYGQPTFTNCVFQGNGSYGAYFSNGNPVFTNCLFAFNNIGLYNFYYSLPLLTNCTIAQNSSDGVKCYYGGNGMLVDCLIANNGCGIREADTASDPTLKYCLLSGNGSGDYYDADSGSYKTISQVNALTSWLGVLNSGNLAGAAGFVNAAAGDFRLLSSSAAIDQAVAFVSLWNGVSAPTSDLDGNPRPCDVAGVGQSGAQAYDIGAYEYQPPIVAPTVTLNTSAPEPTNQSTLAFTATFSEPVSGFEAADITVSGGQVTAFSGSDADYTFEVKPAAAGPVTVSIPAGVAASALGTPNQASAPLSRTYITPVVSQATGQHFGTLQEAVDAAGSGDTLVAGPFVYNEVVTINRPLTLRSEPGQTTATVVNGGLRLNGSQVVIDGLSIRPGPQLVPPLQAVVIEGPFNIVRNSILVNASQTGETRRAGIVIRNSNITIEDNDIRLWAEGVETQGGQSHVIQNNQFEHNQTAILLGTTPFKMRIQGNVFFENNWALDVTEVGTDVKVELNWFLNNLHAIPYLLYGELDARNNWWGDVSGPSSDGTVSDPVTGRKAAGSGDAICNQVLFDPWLIDMFPAIPVSAPGAGAVAYLGQTLTVRWDGTKVMGNVKIMSSCDGGANWTPVIASTDNDAQQDWTVSGPPTTHARLRVASATSDAIFGDSPEFTISAVPQIQLLSPAASATWPKGSAQTIRWSTQGLAGNVKIFASADGGPWQQIANDTPNDGEQAWTVSLAPTASARIRVTSMTSNALYGESGPFTVTAPPSNPAIAVSAPAAGDSVQKGSAQTVRWTSQDVTANVKVFVALDGGAWQQIAVDVPNTGSFLWTVKHGPAAQARIRVTSMSSNTVYGESGSFAITAAAPVVPTITVLDPTASASWAKDATQTIRWSSANLTANVKLFVSLGGAPWQQIANDVANTGSYAWKVNTATSTSARIRVTSMANNAVYGDSLLFTITAPVAPASITVTAPAAGEQVARNTQKTITWTTSNLAGNIKVFVSLDGGAWQQLANDVPNTGSLVWTVKQGPAAQAKVRVTSMASNAVYGESSLFQIVP